MSCTGLSCPSSPCSESGWLRVPGRGAWVLGLVRVMGWPRVSWPGSCPLQQAWAPRTHRPPGSGAECHGALCTSSESHKNNYQPMGTLKRNLQSCLAGTCQGWSESPTQFVLWVFFFFLDERYWNLKEKCVCRDGLSECLEQLRPGFLGAEEVLVCVQGRNLDGGLRQVGLGVLGASLPPVDCLPRFRVRSFLGSNLRPSLC